MSLAMRTASASVENAVTGATGPKISSFWSRALRGTSASTVGSKK